MGILEFLSHKGIMVLTNKSEITPYLRDASYFQGESPLGVALPRDENEISIILSKCYEEDIKVVTRGGGTSLTGSSVSIKNSIVLSTSRLNKILEFSGGDRYVKAQAGLRIDELNSFLHGKKFLYPPDPASSLASTVGGTISTNAGGLRGTYYGSTKEWVLGLGVVLPDGSIIRTGGKTLKRSIGYDLTALFVGSEGTLGVIFDAYLKIVPLIENFARLLIFFKNSEDLGNLIFYLKDSGINPLSAEFADRVSMNIMSKSVGIPFPPEASFMLMLDIPIFKTEDLDQVMNKLKSSEHLQYKILGGEEVDAIYKARKGLYSALLAERNNPGEYIIIGDIVVPSSKVPLALHDTENLIQEVGLKTVLFGHIGDGNIHANIFANIKSEDSMERAREFLIKFGEIAIKYEGSVSAEHGIGYEKKELLLLEFQRKNTTASLNLMRSIKKIIDPKNIMNPGKVFDI